MISKNFVVNDKNKNTFFSAQVVVTVTTVCNKKNCFNMLLKSIIKLYRVMDALGNSKFGEHSRS